MKVRQEFTLPYDLYFHLIIMVIVTTSLTTMAERVPPHTSTHRHSEPKTDATPLQERIFVDQKIAQSEIESVLAGEEFHQMKTIKTFPFLEKFFQGSELERRQFGSLPPWLIDVMLWFAKSIKLLLYCLIIALFILCILRYRHWLQQFRKTKKPRKESEGPQTLFGFDLREKSLPENIPQEVLALWRENKPRKALSLLYRATLTRLISRYACVFLKGNTEEECVALVKQKQSANLSLFFSEITRQWQILAYGHRLPERDIIERLCEKWPHYFEDNRDEQTQKVN